MVETFRRKIQTKDPPLQTYVQAVKSVGDWIIEGYKAKIVPPSAGANALVVRDYLDTEDRLVLTEDMKIKTKNLLLKEWSPDSLALRDVTDTYYRCLRLDGIVFFAFLRCGDPSGFIQTRESATDYITLQSHNGTAYVDCAKLIGGWLEIARGKLTRSLRCNGYNLLDLWKIYGKAGNFDLKIIAQRSAAYAGNALYLGTRNSANLETDRLVITGGVDIAEIKIANSKLNLQSNKLLNPKTFTARPALADMEVGEIAYGIGTGPAGEDEIFFKPDATRISYWTATGTITA